MRAARSTSSLFKLSGTRISGFLAPAIASSSPPLTGTCSGIRPSGFPIALTPYPQESLERRSAPDSMWDVAGESVSRLQ
ncbi:hypothetical protein NDU88_006861 [Pleurodeles waltl]|uniref:Secreted protein n=1 Tax=Pleurodeles waltl TaxID=8319 RepID=A0AAV7ME92_PLEWA|nr:hypothetical protein NDU88_006861 [Pleurodeles waltl]